MYGIKYIKIYLLYFFLFIIKFMVDKVHSEMIIPIENDNIIRLIDSFKEYYNVKNLTQWELGHTQKIDTTYLDEIKKEVVSLIEMGYKLKLKIEINGVTD